MPKKIPREDLVAELRRLADELDRAPSGAEMSEHSEFSPHPYRKEWGTWNDALAHVGLSENGPGDAGDRQRIDSETLLADLRRVTEQLGDAPSPNQYREHGNHSVNSFYRTFGSWCDAREEAGVADRVDFSEEFQERAEAGAEAAAEAIRIDDEDILSEFRRLSEELGRTPTYTDIKQDSKYSARPFERAFGSIPEARVAAGLSEKPNPVEYMDIPTREEMISALQDLGDEVGGAPTQSQMEELGEFSVHAYFNRFRTYNQALREAGFSVNFEPDIKQPVECDYCGETTHKLPDRIERSERDFCSRECKVKFLRETDALAGESNPAWKGGKESYGPGWNKAKREAVRARDGRKCQDCGMAEEDHLDKNGWKLDVHHIVPAREFDDPEARNAMDNLVTLCRSCHSGKWEQIPGLRPDVPEDPAAGD